MIVYFFRDWVQVIAQGFGLNTFGNDPAIRRNPKLLWLLVLGSVPAGIAGLLVKDLAENVWRNNQYLIGSMLILVGLFMWWADRQGSRKKDLGNVSPVDSITIGAAQALALVPGTSRSGITICAGLLRNLDRETAARFSFLLATPAIAGAAAKDAWDLMRHGGGIAAIPQDMRIAMLVGVIVSAIVGRDHHPVLPELPPAEVFELLRVVPGDFWHNSNRSGQLLPLPRGMRFLGPTRHARLNEAGAVAFLIAGLFLFFSLGLLLSPGPFVEHLHFSR